jgi:hypothetical protein
MRFARTVSLLVITLAVTGPLGCGPDAPDGGTTPDADPDDPFCAAGDHRCQENTWQVCEDSAWYVVEDCVAIGQICSPEGGCTPCLPGGYGCVGNQVVVCDAGGNPTDQVIEDCGDTGLCVEGACADPCGDAALAQTNTGCVYYAVDLPQWGQTAGVGFGTIAANQQFAVAIANPWDLAVDVLVEKNDAAPGGAPILSIVSQMTAAPSSLVVIPLPQREVSGYVEGSLRSRSRLSTSAYRITTSRPTSVYQFNPLNNPDAYSNDASLLIPVNALDESYVALGWPGFGGFETEPPFPPLTTDNRSFITIVATRPDTRVRVIPSTHVMPGDDVPAIAPGVEFVVTLGEFETLNLQGDDFDTYGETDFTGTRIEADGPIAVWSGIECITIAAPMQENQCCCDHLEEQLFPRSSLGNDYVAVRTSPRSTGTPEPDYFRVMALSDATTVMTTLPGPDASFMLNKGEMRQILTAQSFVVTASDSVLVGQFMLGQDSTDTLQGDPSFILVPPVAQHRNRYIFLVPSGYADNHLLISIPTGVTPTLDGAPAAGCSRTGVGQVAGVGYDAMICPVGDGTHVLEAPMPFGVVVEGAGPGPVSYGYPGGMDFRPVNEDCDEDSDCPGGEFCSGGTCVEIIQ